MLVQVTFLQQVNVLINVTTRHYSKTCGKDDNCLWVEFYQHIVS